MASYLVQAGTSLYHVTRGGVGTALTLPSGCTLTGTSAAPLRSVLFEGGATPVRVCVGGCTFDFFIDTYGVARPLSIAAPAASPVATVGGGTDLYGVYGVAATFKIKNRFGLTIWESAVSPMSPYTPSLNNQSIRLDAIPISPSTFINARGLYRTTNGGNTLFPWFDIDDNSQTIADVGTPDTRLSLVSALAANFGSPPKLKLACLWKQRVWGIPDQQPHNLRWTEDRLFYAWNPANEIVIPPVHQDVLGLTGVTAFIPRRDQLGVAKNDHIHQIVGDSNDTFQRTQVSDTIGCVSQDSVVVIRDTAYFLGPRGVVEWTAKSIGYISEAQVDGWFTSDTYFNRALFPYARGRYNPVTDAYELLVAAAGSSNLDRWIAFDLRGRRWFGPHKTDGFTPTGIGTDTDFHGTVQSGTVNAPYTIFGSSAGNLYVRDDSKKADDGTAIPFQVDLPPLGSQEPDVTKVFGQPTILTRAESSGTLSIVPKIGALDASEGAPILHDLRKEREVLRRLGTGIYAQLSLRHSDANTGVELRGLEIPYTTIGRR